MKRIATLAVLAAIAAPSALHAQTQTYYWRPLAVQFNPVSNAWDTAVAGWALSNAGNATLPWVNNNDAWFPNVANSHITVNGVAAGSLFFNGGTYTLHSGANPLLTMSGPLTNHNVDTTARTQTFNSDIALSADQDWTLLGGPVTVNGAISGNHTLRKLGGHPLNLHNANNTVRGIHIENNAVNARGGGAITVPTGAITLGSPAQPGVANLNFYHLADQPETVWSNGFLVASGYGEVYYDYNNVAGNYRSNIVNFAGISRENKGVMVFKNQNLSAGDLNTYGNVKIKDGEDLLVNGMLPPWMLNGTLANNIRFLSIDANGALASFSAASGAPNTWQPTDVIYNNAARTISENTEVHALRTQNAITFANNATLAVGSGGLILNGNGLIGEGTLDTLGKELVVNVNNAAASIQPNINANGLTKWGNNMLTVSNMTWSGETYIQQGTLKVMTGEDHVISDANGNNIYGTSLGALQKDGFAKMTFDNANSSFGGLYALQGDVEISDSRLEITGTGTSAGVAGVMAGNNTHNTSITVKDGGVVTCNSRLFIGYRGHNNTLTLDGPGVEWLGMGANAYLAIAYTYSSGPNAFANSNKLHVANGARMVMQGAPANNVNMISGRLPESNNFYGQTAGNGIVVSTNGYVSLNGGLDIGTVQGLGSISSNNYLHVVGPGAEFVVGGTIRMGWAYEGALSHSQKVTVEDGGAVRAGTQVSLGVVQDANNQTSTGYGNNLTIRSNGGLYTTTLLLSSHLRAYDNLAEITTGGLLEANTITSNSPTNNFMHVHDGGVWQLRNVRLPTITAANNTTNGVFVRPVIIENAVLSYSNLLTTAVVVHDNKTQPVLMNSVDWRGHNAFRLNNCATIGSGNDVNQTPTYTFEKDLGPTNYFRLEMVNGETRWRNRIHNTVAQDNAALLTIGASGGEMLCRDTKAFIEIPFECHGELTLCNSTLAFENSATITGEVVVDLSNLPDDVVLKNAVLNGARIRFIGELPEGVETVKLMSGVTGDRFATDASLPKDFSVKHVGDSVLLHWALPRTLFILK